MIEWYKKVVFENYANFNGRARRSEYWYYCLASILISLAFGVLDYFSEFTFIDGQFGILRGVYSLAVFIPNIAVTVRRLHDIGKSGWFMFIVFIPVIGVIWFLISLCTAGDNGTNEYGVDPKNEFDEMDEIGKEFV
ncbi:DUF805 domain-containing protein [Flavobacterium poyangense]|uniref:DUF805 domain-containing protein n=1 Tax=Flavobacterium poyangense TaxID=2204302 RepID=UPI00141D8B14|nr:DUF805 domain-containing protein [Flavobacterium sp. JXAS1]